MYSRSPVQYSEHATVLRLLLLMHTVPHYTNGCAGYECEAAASRRRRLRCRVELQMARACSRHTVPCWTLYRAGAVVVEIWSSGADNSWNCVIVVWLRAPR